jgi:hypothetical protein
LYEQGKVHHAGMFPELEDELVSFTTSGYIGDRSPNRADAAIWACTEFFPRVAASPERRDRRNRQPRMVLAHQEQKLKSMGLSHVGGGGGMSPWRRRHGG